MKVETYEVEEIKGSDASTMAADSESVALIQKLELDGQLEITNPQTETRCPYRQISALEHLVYTALFPTQTPVRRYGSGLIPLRVLQLLAHAKELDMFKRFEVWHTLDHREKDPVLVAYTTENNWESAHKCFILARWGDALPSFDELIEKAKKVWTAKRRVSIANKKADLDRAADNIDADAEAVFATGQESAASYSL